MIFKSKLCTVCDVFSKMGNKIVHIFKPFIVNNERSHLILPKKNDKCFSLQKLQFGLPVM